MEKEALRFPGILSSRRLMNSMAMLAALALGVLLYWATPHGLGLSPDSVAYLKGASGLLAGKGFSYMSGQWPPLYPSLIGAIATITHQDVTGAARVVNALSYAAVLFLAYILLCNAGRMNRFASIILASLISISHVIVHVTFYAWSEPMFLALMLLDLCIVYRIIADEGSGDTLEAILAMVATLALFTRFAGVTVVALNMLAVFVNSRANRQKSWLASIGHACVQIAPMLVLSIVWSGHRGGGDGITNERPFSVHVIPAQKVFDGLFNMGNWFLPQISQNGNSASGMLYAIAGACLMAMTALILIHALYAQFFRSKDAATPWPEGPDPAFTGLLALYSLLYIAFIVSVISFIDPHPPLDNRILAPVFVAMTFMLLLRSLQIKQAWLRVICIVAIGIGLSFSLPKLRTVLLLSYFNGIELNDKGLRESDLNRFVRSCRADLLVFSDQPWKYNLHFNSLVSWTPREYLYGTGLPNADYDNEIRSMLGTATLVIVENRDPKVLQQVESARFTRIFENPQGSVWLNSTARSDYCRQPQ